MPQHRICFISLSAYHYFLDDEPTGGGIQRQFHFLSTHLTGSFDVEFVVGDYGQSRRVSHEEVTLHRAYSPDPTSSVGQRGRQLITLYRALRQADADVYILSSPRKLPVVKLLLYSLRKPLVFHVASDAVVEIPPSGFTGIRRRLYDWALRESATVVAQTPYQATQIRNHWDVAATVIPNGYPPATVVDVHESREYFLWVGRLTETVKRPHLFLDVAEAIPDKRFLLIGPREGQKSYTDSLIERASRLENVRYLGPIAPSEIHNYYRRALAVINTSDFEGFPNTFLEAWRYATPVLSLSVDTGRFLADDRETGFAGGEFEELVSLARTLADDPGRRRELGAHGMETFETQYRLSTVVSSYQELLQSVIAGG